MMSWPAVPQLIATVVLALIMSASHYLDESPKPHEKSTVSHHGQPAAGLLTRHGTGVWQAGMETDSDPGSN